VHLNLVLEYAAGGTLIDFLNKHRKVENQYPNGLPKSWVTTEPISPEVAIRIMREMAQGLKQIHGKGVLHRDILGRNILLMGEPDEWTSRDPLIKYADFGRSFYGRMAVEEDMGKLVDVHGAFKLMKQVAMLAKDGTTLALRFEEAFDDFDKNNDPDPEAGVQAEDLVAIVNDLDENLVV
jgi:serine/threonine protein kinase